MNNPQVEFAKPSIDGFELPCGYLDQDGNLHTELEVREITGPEEEILAATNMLPSKKLTRLMAACTNAIGDFTGAAIEKILPELCQGDRFFIMFAIRRVTLGNDMPMICKCPACEQEQQLTVDLSELDIKKMPDPTKRTYEVTLPKSGKKVQMKVLIGRGEDMIAKAQVNGKDKMTVALLARVDSIEGQPATIADLKALSFADRNFLRDVWEDHEGGIDTSLQIECPSCGHEYEANVDPTQEGFFSPLAVLKRWSKKYST